MEVFIKINVFWGNLAHLSDSFIGSLKFNIESIKVFWFRNDLYLTSAVVYDFEFIKKNKRMMKLNVVSKT